VATPRAPLPSRLLLSLLLLGACAPAREQVREAPSAPRADARRAPPAAPPQLQPRFQRLHASLQRLVDGGQVAGAVGLVLHRGQVAYQGAVGWQDLEAGRRMTPQTLFRLCSMTKPVTAVAAMMLVEEGRLSLADPVSRYIPELTRMTVAEADPDRPGAFRHVPARRALTVRDLLTHQSGLSYTAMAGPYLARLYREAGVLEGMVAADATMEENVRRLAPLPLLHQPGEGWSYGLNMDVLGLVLARASGLTLGELLRTRILAPLGMHDTHFRIPPDAHARLAAAYRPARGGGLERTPEGPVREGDTLYTASYPLHQPDALASGGAGLVSTAGDYARFLRMLLGGGALEGVRLLKPETVAQMTRDHSAGLPLAITAHGDGHGMGFGVVTPALAGGAYGSPGTYSWGGFYNTYFWVDPQRELIGILLTQLHPWDHLGLWDAFRTETYAALAP
jgi:CubicO group peptidase (beta-lactamase class C family)